MCFLDNERPDECFDHTGSGEVNPRETASSNFLTMRAVPIYLKQKLLDCVNHKLGNQT